jgi:hypothetical protein
MRGTLTPLDPSSKTSDSRAREPRSEFATRQPCSARSIKSRAVPTSAPWETETTLHPDRRIPAEERSRRSILVANQPLPALRSCPKRTRYRYVGMDA